MISVAISISVNLPGSLSVVQIVSDDCKLYVVWSKVSSFFLSFYLTEYLTSPSSVDSKRVIPTLSSPVRIARSGLRGVVCKKAKIAKFSQYMGYRVGTKVELKGIQLRKRF